MGIKNYIKRHLPGLASSYRYAHSFWTGRRWIGKGMDSFHEIYRKNVWDCPETVSGSGSTAEQTQKLRKELPNLLTRNQINSVVDAPCGDFNWMKLVDMGSRQYVGIDLVPELIESVREKFGSDRRSFLVLDISKALLPKTDLIICRDCFVHFSNADILATLRNFKRTNSRFLLTTTYPNHPFNTDCPTGHWRMLNLQLPPFNFPTPLELLVEECGEGECFATKSLGLWRLESVLNRQQVVAL